jgi:hypothetical protein
MTASCLWTTPADQQASHFSGLLIIVSGNNCSLLKISLSIWLCLSLIPRPPTLPDCLVYTPLTGTEVIRIPGTWFCLQRWYIFAPQSINFFWDDSIFKDQKPLKPRFFTFREKLEDVAMMYIRALGSKRPLEPSRANFQLDPVRSLFWHESLLAWSRELQSFQHFLEQYLRCASWWMFTSFLACKWAWKQRGLSYSCHQGQALAHEPGPVLKVNSWKEKQGTWPGHKKEDND